MKRTLLKNMTDRLGRKYDPIEIQTILDEKGNYFLGELGIGDNATIEMDRVSHKFTDVLIEGDDLVGELTILNTTPCGKILQELFNTLPEDNLYSSMKCLGMVDSNNNVTELEIIGFDVLYD